MKTRITELFKIKYPIIQGGMQWLGTAELVAAVSEAGGLGILTALTQASPTDLAREIKRTRQKTDKPFGVNLTILPTISPVPYFDYLSAIIDSGVDILELAGNNPEKIMEKLRGANIRVIHKCTTIRHALTAERLGVDVISIDGFECAGHCGENDVGGLVLIRQAARKLGIPIIASGGIADGYGLAAALALGADGINMGTRFFVTRESPADIRIKEALLKASEIDTALVLRTLRNTSRVLRNKISEEVLGIESQRGGCEFEAVRSLVSGSRGRNALMTGAIDDGLIGAGQSVGLIEDIPTCHDLIERMIAECNEQASRILTMSQTPGN